MKMTIIEGKIKIIYSRYKNKSYVKKSRTRLNRPTDSID